MIDEKEIEALIERLVDRIEKANTIFLEGIGSSLKEIGELTPTKARQLVQILKYGGKYDEIIEQISRYTNLNIADIDDIFSNYAKKDLFFYEKFYKYRNIPFLTYDANIPLKTQTMALANIVKNEMYNYARANVLGYAIKDIDGKVRFLGMRDTYNELLDNALLNVGQGKDTFDGAMNSILKEIGNSGLKTINYESGRNIRLDSAIRMHLQGRLRELHNENQKIIGDEIQADGIEISVHGNPAPDHQDVQGKQFSNEEFDIIGVAADGQEALQIASENRPDIIILDLLLPQYDGISVLDLISVRYTDCKVFVATGFISNYIVYRSYHKVFKG